MIEFPKGAPKDDIVQRGRHGDLLELFRGTAGKLTFVVFYADCHHQVQPVKTGYRVALTCNLMLECAGAAAVPAGADLPAQIDALKNAGVKLASQSDEGWSRRPIDPGRRSRRVQSSGVACLVMIVFFSEGTSRRLLIASLACLVVLIVYANYALIPLNRKIGTWTPASPPADWKIFGNDLPRAAPQFLAGVGVRPGIDRFAKTCPRPLTLPSWIQSHARTTRMRKQTDFHATHAF